LFQNLYFRHACNRWSRAVFTKAFYQTEAFFFRASQGGLESSSTSGSRGIKGKSHRPRKRTDEDSPKKIFPVAELELAGAICAMGA
jgi:hypothetical protein